MKNIMTINKCVLDESCELWDCAQVYNGCLLVSRETMEILIFQALLGL